MKKIALSLATIGAIALPIIALAQIGGPTPKLDIDLTTFGLNIANAAWIIFTIIAVVMFVVAGVLFLTARGNPEQVQQARNAFLWGVVGVVVAILAFTIITLVTRVVSTGQ
jgi:RsiW-degrading membrane proteinase PrsW (M82 family)